MDTIDLLSLPLAIIALALVIYGKIYNWFRKKPQHLTDLRKSTANKAHGIIFGKIGKKVVFSPTADEGSIGLFSASGTGKTSAVGIPTLRSWSGTSYTIDISGDICKNCPDMPYKLVFDPDSLDTTPYNVFGVIDALETAEEQNEALEQLAYLMMPETPGINENARFFLINGRKILTSALIAFYHTGMDFIQICEKIVGSSWNTLFDSIDSTHNDSAIMYINSFLGASDQNTAGCKQSCDDAIKLFAVNARIKKSVRRPSPGRKEIAITPSMIEHYNIFVIVPDPKIDIYSPLLNIITSQVMQYISNRSVTDNSQEILLLLDEFASLQIDSKIVLDALRKYRKRKCRVMLMTQNLADLDLIYGHDTTRAIMANLRFKLLLGGLAEPESQKYFADLIGYRKVTKHSTSKNSHNTTQTVSEEKEYIIDPDKLDKQGKDKLILLHPEGNGYMILQKNYYFS